MKILAVKLGPARAQHQSTNVRPHAGEHVWNGPDGRNGLHESHVPEKHQGAESVVFTLQEGGKL